MSWALALEVVKSGSNSELIIPALGSCIGMTTPHFYITRFRLIPYASSHIDWHLEAGLAVVFAEDPEGMVDGPDSVIVTEEWQELCPAYRALPTGLQYG